MLLLIFLGASCARKAEEFKYEKDQTELYFESEIKSLISENKNLDNVDGVSPIINAVNKNYLDSVRLLIKNGANVNVRESHTGSTALHAAVAPATAPRPNEMEEKIIRLLLENNADMTIADNMGITPLSKAAANGRLEAFNILLEAGANPQDLDGNGLNALHHAASKGYYEIVQILIDREMDVNKLTSRNESPLDLANHKTSKRDYENARQTDEDAFPGADYEKTIEILKEAGALTGKEISPSETRN